MGLFTSFSKQRKPRGFHLQHRYHDERKSRLKKLESNNAISRENKRKKIRQAWNEKRKSANYKKKSRLLIILIAIILIWISYNFLPDFLLSNKLVQ